LKEKVTMIDEIFDRTYQPFRADLNAGVGLIFRKIGKAAGNAFRVLHRIEYDAPWAARHHGRRRAA
jgi:hypothetical protein